MKIVVYSRSGEGMGELTGALAEAGLPYGLWPDGRSGADVAVSWGGDGTFLDCVRLVGRHGIPVLGINSGRLGFLANVPREGMARAFADLAAGRYATEPRALIEAAGDFPGEPEYPFAFNEFSLQRGGSGMIAVEAYIDGEMVATYWGDGAIFSTPAGSTAYALSVGGPVVAPGCGCFVIAPIAPHNLTMRPVVVPDTGEVMLRVSTREGYAYASLDGSRHEVADGATFRLKKAAGGVRVVRLPGTSFYDTLRNKLYWGLDSRGDK